MYEAYLNNLSCFSKFNAKGEHGGTVRCMKETERHIFVFAKGMKRRGYRYTVEDFLSTFTPVIVTEEKKEKQWKNRLKRAVSAIEETGLWKGSPLHELLKNLQNVDYEDLEKIRLFYRDHSFAEDVTKNAEINPYLTKYPFMFTAAKDGGLRIHPDYICELSECKLKSTYFGKYVNASTKEHLRWAIENKRNTRQTGITSYDVSFELKFSDDSYPRAWYSEEYHGCGNGHYYLALSENLAIFCEDD